MKVTWREEMEQRRELILRERVARIKRMSPDEWIRETFAFSSAAVKLHELLPPEHRDAVPFEEPIPEDSIPFLRRLAGLDPLPEL